MFTCFDCQSFVCMQTCFRGKQSRKSIQTVYGNFKQIFSSKVKNRRTKRCWHSYEYIRSTWTKNVLLYSHQRIPGIGTYLAYAYASQSDCELYWSLEILHLKPHSSGLKWMSPDNSQTNLNLTSNSSLYQKDQFEIRRHRGTLKRHHNVSDSWLGHVCLRRQLSSVQFYSFTFSLPGRDEVEACLEMSAQMRLFTRRIFQNTHPNQMFAHPKRDKCREELTILANTSWIISTLKLKALDCSEVRSNMHCLCLHWMTLWPAECLALVTHDYRFIHFKGLPDITAFILPARKPCYYLVAHMDLWPANDGDKWAHAQ